MEGWNFRRKAGDAETGNSSRGRDTCRSGNSGSLDWNGGAKAEATECRGRDDTSSSASGVPGLKSWSVEGTEGFWKGERRASRGTSESSTLEKKALFGSLRKHPPSHLPQLEQQHPHQQQQQSEVKQEKQVEERQRQILRIGTNLASPDPAAALTSAVQQRINALLCLVPLVHHPPKDMVAGETAAEGQTLFGGTNALKGWNLSSPRWIFPSASPTPTSDKAGGAESFRTCTDALGAAAPPSPRQWAPPILGSVSPMQTRRRGEARTRHMSESRDNNRKEDGTERAATLSSTAVATVSPLDHEGERGGVVLDEEEDEEELVVGYEKQRSKSVMARSRGETSMELWSKERKRLRRRGATDALLKNAHTPYFEIPTEWKAADKHSVLQSSLVQQQERKKQTQRRRRMASRLLAAQEFHSQFDPAPMELPTPQHSLPLALAWGPRIITIVTTACLPWLTGTSINPLLRGAYLSKDWGVKVVLVFPWIPESDQLTVHPAHIFHTQQEQADHVRHWLLQRLGFLPLFDIRFYDAWYDPRKGSCFPLDGSDVTEFVCDEESDVAVLEEPEHLTWYHMVGPKWRTKFHHSVGIAHTNYVEYIKRDKLYGGDTIALFVWLWSAWQARANCHLVIRLSAAVQWFANSVVCNVHGVSPQFLAPGPPPDTTGGIYFVGKILWGKGYRELCDLLLAHITAEGTPTQHLTREEVPKDSSKAKSKNRRKAWQERVWVHAYGSGPDEGEVKDFANRHNLPITFHGRKDHADPELRTKFSIFVNPSLSDVLCTTTAEAAAMGKILVLARHPSNDFFVDNFASNCILYDPNDTADFSNALRRALERQPQPLSPEQQKVLTWEAATERFMQVSGID